MQNPHITSPSFRIQNCIVQKGTIPFFTRKDHQSVGVEFEIRFLISNNIMVIWIVSKSTPKEWSRRVKDSWAKESKSTVPFFKRRKLYFITKKDSGQGSNFMIGHSGWSFILSCNRCKDHSISVEPDHASFPSLDFSSPGRGGRKKRQRCMQSLMVCGWELQTFHSFHWELSTRCQVSKRRNGSLWVFFN